MRPELCLASAGIIVGGCVARRDNSRGLAAHHHPMSFLPLKGQKSYCKNNSKNRLTPKNQFGKLEWSKRRRRRTARNLDSSDWNGPPSIKRRSHTSARKGLTRRRTLRRGERISFGREEVTGGKRRVVLSLQGSWGWCVQDIPPD